MKISPGVYFFGNLSFNNGDKSNWSLGPALYVEVIKGFGVGLTYDGLREGVGFEFPKSDNLAIVLGYDIKF